MRNVATFWNDEQKYSLRYLPTSGLARAFTRSASALFHVKRGSSKLPDTCRTKTSFCSFFAFAAADDGVSKNSTLVPWSPQPPSALVGGAAGLPLAGTVFSSPARAGPQPATAARHRPAAARNRKRCMWDPPGMDRAGRPPEKGTGTLHPNRRDRAVQRLPLRESSGCAAIPCH